MVRILAETGKRGKNRLVDISECQFERKRLILGLFERMLLIVTNYVSLNQRIEIDSASLRDSSAR